MRAFDFYIGIDYSGAQMPTSSLKGLRVYMADRKSPPNEKLGTLPYCPIINGNGATSAKEYR